MAVLPVRQTNRRMRTCVVVLWCAAAGGACYAQSFTTLVNFTSANGNSPYASLVQGLDGDFYGTTLFGGTNTGSLFKMTPAGLLTNIHSFAGPEGALPYFGALVQAANGKLYGTTQSGGTATICFGGCGMVFSTSPTGKVTPLYSFTGLLDGYGPKAGLVLATNGSFYGSTEQGGANGAGTLFKITSAGILTTLYSFAGFDGANPTGTLIQATDGNLYGTTHSGGSNNAGTIFKLSLTGALTTLASLDGISNFAPFAGLIQATDGNFYGTTAFAGINGTGSIFKITPAGVLTTLYGFNGPDGASPYSALVQATDSNFYGTTQSGGSSANGFGTIFEITPGGALTTLHSFDGTDGSYPFDALTQATDGTFYGTTSTGGAAGAAGTVFSLSMGFGPFVKASPTSGKVGSSVRILGTNLTGATSVTFHGTAASFTTISASEIKATVPSGATTGKIQVVTPGGTLLSNVSFRVP
jgi:uncharacterized repeat protein (TIGR03803 family)